ncbi:MAG: metallophosphatase family protein, partial [Chloroflexota bacterium]|nr:metallophosphatase family protein [Chloroflexota bacterium]
MADLERTFAVPLTIGVVSDTHMYERGRRQLPIEVLEVFERAGVGLIVHAGDLNDRTVLSELEAIAPV